MKRNEHNNNWKTLNLKMLCHFYINVLWHVLALMTWILALYYFNDTAHKPSSHLMSLKEQTLSEPRDTYILLIFLQHKIICWECKKKKRRLENQTAACAVNTKQACFKDFLLPVWLSDKPEWPLLWQTFIIICYLATGGLHFHF